MAKEKKKSKTKLGTKQPSKELLESIWDMFQTQDATNQKRFDDVRKDLTEKISNSQRELTVLIEQIDRKVTEAALPAQMTSDHELKIKEHDGRIENLERDVSVVKRAVTSKNP